jgi:hypothetical protein
MEALTKLIGLEKKSLKYRNETIHYFLCPLGKLGDNPFKAMERTRDPMQAISMLLSTSFSGFAYVLDQDELYIAESAQGLMSYLDWRDSRKPALSGNRDFLDAVEKGNHRGFNFMYIDPRSAVKKWCNTLRFGLRTFEGYIRKAGVPLETALVPRGHSFARYLLPGTICISTDDNGLLITSRGSANIGLVGVAAVGITAALAIPAIQAAQQKAKKAASMAQLQSIGTALIMYRMEYGKIPPTGEKMLEELVEKNFISRSILKENYECTSIPWEWYKEQSRFPVVWKRSADQRFVLILFADGHVDTMSSYSFTWMLETIHKKYERREQKPDDGEK